MFWTRVATAAVLLPLFISALFFLPGAWWAAALLPLVLAGAWEWGALTGLKGGYRQGYCGAILATALLFLLPESDAPYLQSLERAAYCVSVLFWVSIVPFWLFGWRMRNAAFLGLVGWVLLVPTWLALVRLQALPWVLLAIMGVIWVADSAAYFAGRVWGRHKLAPMISPGKTWEGVAGAVVAVAGYHVLVWNMGFSGKIPESAGIAALLVAVLVPMSIIGDLFESSVKRQAGMKDSGRLFPGHGGVLDRIDGLTPTLPIAALTVMWVLQGHG